MTSGSSAPSVTRHTLHELRYMTTEQIRATGDYDLAYCPVCGCTKSGVVTWPNQNDPGCSRWRCRCHHDHDEMCNGILDLAETRLCAYDEYEHRHSFRPPSP